MEKHIALLLIALSSAHANLIDLTPGGTPIDLGPPAFVQLTGFYDEAALGFFNGVGGTVFYQGWVSKYGILNGGQYFFTDLFSQPSAPTANVSWNFGNSGYWLEYIDVVGWDQIGGPAVDNLYRVPWNSRLSSQDVVTLDGRQHITGIAFYGHNPALPIPDSGSTALLLPIGVAGLIVLRKGRSLIGLPPSS
jgi:hypothetical protein